MKKVLFILLALMLAVSVAVVGCAPAEEEPPPEEPDPWADAKAFYKGKTIYFYTAVPGSGMDLMSRFLASYLGKALNATVVVSAYAGAGGLESFNKLWTDKDTVEKGLLMAGHSLTTVWQNWLLDPPSVAYKADQLIYLGSVLCPPMALWTKPAKYGNITALRATIPTLIVFGRASPLGYINLWGQLASRWLGLNYSVAFIGGPTPLKAKLLDETIDYTNISVHWTETHGVPLHPDVRPVVMLSDQPYDLYDKFGINKLFTVPALTAVPGVNIPPDQASWFDLMKVAGEYNMPGLAFPPGVESYKVNYMKKVLNDITSDPVFIADATGRFGEFTWHNATQVEARYQYYCVTHNATLHAIKTALGL